MRVSYLAMHMEGRLAELDINPLMVLPAGRGVKAVDALVVFRGTWQWTGLSVIAAWGQISAPNHMQAVCKGIALAIYASAVGEEEQSIAARMW